MARRAPRRASRRAPVARTRAYAPARRARKPAGRVRATKPQTVRIVLEQRNEPALPLRDPATGQLMLPGTQAKRSRF